MPAPLETNPSGEATRVGRLSPLQQTLEYHHSIGSTPPDYLVQNPGKTRAETMTDEEISAYLDKARATIARFEALVEENDRFFEDLAIGSRKDLEEDLAYLASIGRLPVSTGEDL